MASSPWTWTLLAGLATGLALSLILPRAGGNPDAGRRLSFAAIAASIAVALVLAAVFVPGPSKALEPGLWRAFGITALASLPAFRFPRAVGIAMAALAAGASALVILSRTDWVGRGPDGVFLVARRFGIDVASARLEVTWNGDPRPVALPLTVKESLEVERLSFHPAWSILGDTEWLRPAGRGGNFDWLYAPEGLGLPGAIVTHSWVNLSGIGLMGTASLRVGSEGELRLE